MMSGNEIAEPLMVVDGVTGHNHAVNVAAWVEQGYPTRMVYQQLGEKRWHWA